MRKANKAPRGPIRMRAHAKPSFSFGRTVIKIVKKVVGKIWDKQLKFVS